MKKKETPDNRQIIRSVKKGLALYSNYDGA